MKRKGKKKRVLSKAAFTFNASSLTRFHVYREINSDEAVRQLCANSTANVQCQDFSRRPCPCLFFSSLLWTRFGSMTSNLFPSVRPFDPSLPLPVFAVQSVFSPASRITNRLGPCCLIIERDGLRNNPFLSLGHPSRY